MGGLGKAFQKKKIEVQQRTELALHHFAPEGGETFFFYGHRNFWGQANGHEKFLRILNTVFSPNRSANYGQQA